MYRGCINYFNFRNKTNLLKIRHRKFPFFEICASFCTFMRILCAGNPCTINILIFGGKSLNFFLSSGERKNMVSLNLILLYNVYEYKFK